MNLYLVGYRCTGKTTVGKELARLLEMAFVDTDAWVEQEAGRSIERIVAEHGWPEFRRREHKALARAAAATGQVVATGGGVVLDGANVKRMHATGKVVWLRAPAAVICRRMAADPASPALRPSLTGRDPLREVEAVLAERRNLYAAAAHLAVDTDRDDIQALCRRIARWFTGRAATEP